MGNRNEAAKIDYQALEQQRSLALQNQLKDQLRGLEDGKHYSLRRTVLRLVVDAQYDEATEVVEKFLEAKRKYPSLIPRISPHITHAKELINAVRAKRTFPNLSQLSMSKQQEILDYAIGHFEELKQTLKTVEQTTRDEAVKDIRSTEWVVRVTFYTIIGVVSVAFFVDFIRGGIPQSIWKIYTSIFNTFLDKIF